MTNHGIRTCKSEPSCSLTAVGMISGEKRSSSSESGVNEDIMNGYKVEAGRLCSTWI
jgi:hypothetical protein